MKKPLKSFRQTNLQNHDTAVHPEIQLVSKRMAFFADIPNPYNRVTIVFTCKLAELFRKDIHEPPLHNYLKSRALSWTTKDAIVEPLLALDFHPKCIVLATVKRSRRNRQPLKSTGAAAGIIT
ncbi:hypothetical protein KC19_5G110700 [Ceratodon purpureus]|uniref:Uncharacterized protein n=1 Tax=Ceratodon purpureus TaxID=3225 RepID=A0A8T0I143_CERPU|nr:hypothetical protein KC19_5G110700 [Ceratodon purpureus]